MAISLDGWRFRDAGAGAGVYYWLEDPITGARGLERYLGRLDVYRLVRDGSPWPQDRRCALLEAFSGFPSIDGDALLESLAASGLAHGR